MHVTLCCSGMVLEGGPVTIQGAGHSEARCLHITSQAAQPHCSVLGNAPGMF